MGQIIFNTIWSVTIYVLIAHSFSIIYRTVRFFHLAHAGAIIVGAYGTYFFHQVLGFPFTIAAIFAIAISVSIIVLIHSIIYRPLLKLNNIEPWQLLVVSLGIYIVVQNLISMYFGDSTLSFRSQEIGVLYNFYGVIMTKAQLIGITAAIIITAMLKAQLHYTKLGTKINAVASNKELSSVIGVSPNRIIYWSFILGTFLAAASGILIALDSDMKPRMGFAWMLNGVIAMIIGGFGKLRFIILGAILIALSQNLAAYYFDSKWMNATSFIFLIIFLAWKPYGFSGQKLRKAEI